MDEENNSADYTVGIFQSIGFKEFHDYLKLGTEEQKGPLGQKLFEEGKEQMMLATRQVDAVLEFRTSRSSYYGLSNKHAACFINFLKNSSLHGLITSCMFY